jgi:hypothetical protein
MTADDKAWDAYFAKFQQWPMIPCLSFISDEMLSEILLRAVENNAPIDEAAGEAIERELWPQVRAPENGELVMI